MTLPLTLSITDSSLQRHQSMIWWGSERQERYSRYSSEFCEPPPIRNRRQNRRGRERFAAMGLLRIHGVLLVGLGCCVWASPNHVTTLSRSAGARPILLFCRRHAF